MIMETKKYFFILVIVVVYYIVDFIWDRNQGITIEREKVNKLNASQLEEVLYKKRIQNIYRYCDQKDVNITAYKKYLGNFLVDDKHEVIYCHIPKIGSTTWKHILINNIINGFNEYLSKNTQAFHKANIINTHYKLTRLNSLYTEDISQKIQNYFKFLVVRHPLDRLVSAYYDKLAGNNSLYERRFGSKILKELRPKASANAITEGKGVTFKEYLKYITTYGIKDQHFLPIHSICSPCVIKYNYIAKLESHDADSHFIIKNVLSGFESGSDMIIHAKRGGVHDGKHLKEFDNIDYETILKVLKYVETDMKLFGYSVNMKDGKLFAKSVL